MIFRWLLILVPISLLLRYAFHAPPLVLFVSAAAAIIPLAEWIRRSTEQLARSLGSAIGGLLNVTFGNAAELLIAIFVLLEGKDAVVKAQITGSFIGNGLLGLGLAILVGSWGREKQTFNRQSAGRLSSLLTLVVIALLVPALFDYTERSVVRPGEAGRLDEKLSLGVSIILILIYAANLVYTLVTHRDMFRSAGEEDTSEGTRWPIAAGVGVLVAATALASWEAEIVSGELEGAAGALGLSEFFLGIAVLAVIGNAAEYLTAVYFARKDRMTMVMGITVGSSIQIALLIAPVLVLLSYAIGRPMNLVFSNPLELIAMGAVAFIVNSIAEDGESTWFEGALLLGVYAVLILAFLFVV